MISKILKHFPNIFFQLVSILTVVYVFSIETEAKEYRGINPLKTTRSQVESKFGKPDKNGNYKADGEVFKVFYVDTYYSSECNNKNNCDCLVSKDTVNQIRVSFGYDLPLENFNLDLTRYKQTNDTHLLSYMTLSNDEEGIIYTVWKDDNTVTSITYLPAKEDCELLLKNTLNSKSN